MGNGTDWLPVLLSGTAGSVIGTIGAFSAAIVVVRRQTESDRRLAAEAREALALDAAIQMVGEVYRRALEVTTSAPDKEQLKGYVVWLISRWPDMLTRVGRVSGDARRRMQESLRELTKSGSDFDAKDVGALRDSITDFLLDFGSTGGVLEILSARQRMLYALPEQKKRRWLRGKKDS